MENVTKRREEGGRGGSQIGWLPACSETGKNFYPLLSWNLYTPLPTPKALKKNFPDLTFVTCSFNEPNLKPRKKKSYYPPAIPMLFFSPFLNNAHN